ncbi:hypothetical protein C8F04DRAFT_1200291 [Mycena alexandri]|uniref:Uncharacterized protein n=1 Tax=Mycena alexandri TaxID=1745969 RepID=A0AAD6S0C0_9AGAR|nr:hypothetical protein C8F04DRAFT_1200291 [Mycena alexandri]
MSSILACGSRIMLSPSPLVTPIERLLPGPAPGVNTTAMLTKSPKPPAPSSSNVPPVARRAARVRTCILNGFLWLIGTFAVTNCLLTAHSFCRCFDNIVLSSTDWRTDVPKCIISPPPRLKYVTSSSRFAF